MDNKYAVLDALTRAASQNTELLKGAEHQLKSWEREPGFHTTLLNIVSDQNLDINIRWLSVLCLKNGVDSHWRNTITDEEKIVIRGKLLLCMNEPVNQIALQLAVIIAKVARYDFPKHWHELFPALLNGIQSTDQLHHLRALLTGHHVIKTLASKRLTYDQKIFQELTSKIFDTIFLHWINYSKLFLEELNKDITKSSQLLESAFLSLKILRKLIVYGYKDCSKEPTAVNFLSLILQQIRPFLECRIAFQNRNQMQQMCEKYLILLVKVLQDIVEVQPFSFIQFIQPTLEGSVSLCFKKEFQDFLFERLILEFLNLIKAIVMCIEYNKKKYEEESKEILISEADKIRKEFFTPPVLREICDQLLSRYFVLSENDLNSWENEPEEFATEEKGESWKVSLRPCTEVFFLSLFRDFRELMTPIVVEMANTIQMNSTNDLIGILKKEAVYNAIGLAAFDLYDEIDFDKFFTDVLIPELKAKGNGCYIIRRRIIWLIGQWCTVKMSIHLRPLVYDIMLEFMGSNENLVVRLTAANALKNAMDDFEFREVKFHPHLGRSISLLFNLLLEVKECDLKMSVLHVFTVLVQRMDKDVQPHVDSLMQYLPQLWQSCGDHNMLRCAIVSCFVQLVKSLDTISDALQASLIEMIGLCTDVSQPPHVYLLEDGLDLWWNVMKNTAVCSPNFFNLAASLLPLLEYNNESLPILLEITEGYILLSPENYLKRYGQQLAETFQSAVTDLKSEGINLILKVVDTAFIVFPNEGPLLYQPMLPFVLDLILQPDELPISLSIYLSLLSRVILHNQSCFVNTLQERANKYQKHINTVFGELFDVWLKKMPVLNPLRSRKLMGLALACLLTSGSEIVHDRICGILLAIVEVLNDITNHEDSSEEFFVDTEKIEMYSSIFPEHVKRLVRLNYVDPTYTVVLKDFLRNQMMALEQSVGTAKFQDLMSTVDVETMDQLKQYLQN